MLQRKMLKYINLQARVENSKSILGYSYTLNKENNLRMYIYWRCKDRQCKGTAITSNDILISSKEHQHVPDPTKVKVLFLNLE